MPAASHFARGMPPMARDSKHLRSGKEPDPSGGKMGPTASRKPDCKTARPAIVQCWKGFDVDFLSRMFRHWQNHCETGLRRTGWPGRRRKPIDPADGSGARGKTPRRCAIRREVGLVATVPNHPGSGRTPLAKGAFDARPRTAPVARRMRFLFAGSPVPAACLAQARGPR